MTTLNNPYLYSLQNQLAQLSKEVGIELVEGKLLGKTFENRDFILSPKDQENHIHAIGSTGTGKSKFIELILRLAIFDRSHGFCLIDPHGKLYDDLLLYIAHECPEVADRLILFNPAKETDHVLGFNPLFKARNSDGTVNLDDLDYRIGTMVSACLKVWGQNDTDKTPRIARWLETIFYTLLVNDLSLVEAAALISTRSNPARDAMMAKVANFLMDEEWKGYEASPMSQKQTQIEGAGNRLRRFLSSEILRNILGQQEHVLDFQQVMDEGKIVLVNLSSQGKLYHENLRLLGVLMVNEIFRVAQLRDYKKKDLTPFYLYIDEFAKFVSRDIANMLEETRKFKVYCTLAHQHLEQLMKEDEYLYASVMTNCKTKVVFGDLSVQDAEIMAEQIATGYLNLYAIKDKMYQTKVHHREERRVTLSRNIGLMQSENWSENQSVGLGHAKQKGTAEQKGSSVATGASDTVGQGWQYSQGKSVMEGINIVKGITQAIGEQLTLGLGSSDTEGSSAASNWSDGTQSNETASASNTRTDGRNSGNSSVEGKVLQEHQGVNSSVSQQQGASRTTGANSQRGGSVGSNQAHTDSRNLSLGNSLSNAVSNQIGHSLQVGFTEQMGISGNESHTDSRTVTDSESLTKSQSETDSINVQQGQSVGGSTGYNMGYSESITPFLSPEEYQELMSRTFWSLEELKYLATAIIKNQQTGFCFIKTPGNAPVQIKVEHVETIEYDEDESPILIDDVRNIAFLFNQRYFKSAREARREYEQRQFANLKMVIAFDGKPPVMDAEKIVEVTTEEVNPFNRAGRNEK